MVIISVTFKCDVCGKEKTQNVTKRKGYEDADYLLNNKDAAYMPEGWSCDESYKTLSCKKCTKRDDANGITTA